MIKNSSHNRLREGIIVRSLLSVGTFRVNLDASAFLPWRWRPRHRGEPMLLNGELLFAFAFAAACCFRAQAHDICQSATGAYDQAKVGLASATSIARRLGRAADGAAE